MRRFERFDVAAVPFPYVELAARKRRPVVVVSGAALHDRHRLAWVLMITSAANRPWPDDIAIPDHAAAGLPRASVIRPVKIATVEIARCAYLGRLAATTIAALATYVRQTMGDGALS